MASHVRSGVGQSDSYGRAESSARFGNECVLSVQLKYCETRKFIVVQFEPAQGSG